MNRPPLKRSNRTAVCMSALLALCLSSRTPAQTLARPGWVGSGMTAQSWFRHAVLYRIETRSFAHSAADPDAAPGTLKGITERLDYIRNLGIDAILLEPLTVVGDAAPISPTLGTVDDFDELSLQASKRNLRILLTLRDPNAALARYWLTRGVAGFYIPGAVAAPALQPIRKLLPTFVGQRILITDADLSATGAPVKSPANELQLNSAIVKLPTPPATGSAAQLRGALEPSQNLQRAGAGVPMLATDNADVPRSASRFAPSDQGTEAAKLLGAVLLLSRAVPVVYAGQELGLTAPTGGTAITIPWGKAPPPPADADAEPVVQAAAPPPPPAPPQAEFSAPEKYVPYVAPVRPAKPAKPAPPDPASVAGQELDADSILSFYRQLIQLHHGRPSVRDGDEMLLNHDDANALVFVRKPAVPSVVAPPLVVVCNLADKPTGLSLKSEMTNLHLRGSFLRSVLHSESASVSMNLDAVALPAFGVYIGELRY